MSCLLPVLVCRHGHGMAWPRSVAHRVSSTGSPSI